MSATDRPGSGAARWGVAVVVVLALAGVGLGVALRDRQDPEVAAGGALYEANCVMCHGEAGLGDGPMASSLPIRPPSLLDHLTHHTQAQLVQIIRTGLPPAMPPAPLDDDEVRLVIDYVWTLVPDSARAALRAMQAQTEQSGMGTAPGGGHVAEFAFAGTVAAVDTVARSVAVLNDDVPGWMGSMTMSYALNPPDILTTLTVGDRITATVRAGDFGTLYDVEVAPPQ